MRKVVVPPEIFSATILRDAVTQNPHVIKWSGTYPQMVDPLWRNDVLDIFSRLHRNKFTDFKFIGPDDLDDEWVFIASKKDGAWSNINESNVEQVIPNGYGVLQPQPLKWYDIMLSASIVASIGGGFLLIVYAIGYMIWAGVTQ